MWSKALPSLPKGDEELENENERTFADAWKPTITAGKDYKASFLKDQAVYKRVKPEMNEREKKFRDNTLNRKNTCSPSFAESVLEEKKIDSKLTKM